jgi:hypothetical protein
VLVVTTAPGTDHVLATAVEELSAFAAQATLALEVAERRRDAERLVVYEDRDRIARDLHDLVIQRLFATGMQLESAARLVERPEAAARVRRAVDDLDTTIREIRSTIYALTTEPAHEQASLRSRLFEVVDAGAEQLAHAPAVRMSGLVDTTVPPAVGRAPAGGAARGAVQRRAGTPGRPRVEVVLEVGDGVRLTVRDDGRGCPPSPPGAAAWPPSKPGRRRSAGPSPQAPGPSGGTELTWTAPLYEPWPCSAPTPASVAGPSARALDNARSSTGRDRGSRFRLRQELAPSSQDDDPRALVRLDRAPAWSCSRPAAPDRLAYVARAGVPDIVPVNLALDGGRLLVRSGPGPKLQGRRAPGRRRRRGRRHRRGRAHRLERRRRRSCPATAHQRGRAAARRRPARRLGARAAVVRGLDRAHARRGPAPALRGCGRPAAHLLIVPGATRRRPPAEWLSTCARRGCAPVRPRRSERPRPPPPGPSLPHTW